MSKWVERHPPKSFREFLNNLGWELGSLVGAILVISVWAVIGFTLMSSPVLALIVAIAANVGMFYFGFKYYPPGGGKGKHGKGH